jgi:Acetyltransferase (GNAT) domain
MTFTGFGTDQPGAWNDVVDRLAHDVFHRHAYHLFAEARHGGQALLFVHQEGEHVVAMPLLLRPIGPAPGVADDRIDATSVYGYVGPICSDPPPPTWVVARFSAALAQELRARGAVTAFSRLHPLLDQPRLLVGLGRCQRRGLTVAVDLDVDDHVRRSRYRKDHRRGLRRLEQEGVEAHVDHGLVQLDDFATLHRETMDRVGADREHRLTATDIDALARALRGHLFHVVCEHDGAVVAGGLYTTCRGIVQAHLGATRTSALSLAPARLEIDTALCWARASGHATVHLGGGIGARHDSLFAFKRGFGGELKPFTTWQAVLDGEAFRRLCAATPVARDDGDFFPPYRAPQTES